SPPVATSVQGGPPSALLERVVRRDRTAAAVALLVLAALAWASLGAAHLRGTGESERDLRAVESEGDVRERGDAAGGGGIITAGELSASLAVRPYLTPDFRSS
ncbi:MAG: hypothetical protein ABJC36_10905, partial [Gemmatimonadales bacterium]